MVHEATFADTLEKDAEAKKHSTTAEAIQVSRAMNARVLLLTHFSQRYPKLPALGSDPASHPTGFAFDYMRLRFDQLPLLPVLVPALQVIFDETGGDDDDDDDDAHLQ